MQTPFSISPLPSALYLTPSLKASVHKTLYTINNRQGLSCILGDPGTGKSSLLRRLEADLAAESEIKLSFIPDPELSSTFAFVRNICDFFDISAKRSLDRQKQAFRDFVFAQAEEGYNVVLLLDEAHGLSTDMFEVIRSFLNYETNSGKLIQIVLAGQLELREKLKANRPIRSRVTMYSLLDSLSLEEMKMMLNHRCENAGVPYPFHNGTIERIYQWSAGNPRDILRICASAYELAKLYDMEVVSTELIESAITQEEIALKEEEATSEQVLEAAAS